MHVVFSRCCSLLWETWYKKTLECLTWWCGMISASEPNLKVRSALKQKVMERRITQSPILRRRHDKGLFLKRKPALSSMYSYAYLWHNFFIFSSPHQKNTAAGILAGKFEPWVWNNKCSIARNLYSQDGSANSDGIPFFVKLFLSARKIMVENRQNSKKNKQEFWIIDHSNGRQLLS